MLKVKGISDGALSEQLPHVMGTQHPDNVSTPPFGTSPKVTREIEDAEVLYNIRDLPIPEIMIDYEKKRGDITPLWDWIHKCQACMAERVIGRDWHVTPRLPNGDTERDDPISGRAWGFSSTHCS